MTVTAFLQGFKGHSEWWHSITLPTGEKRYYREKLLARKLAEIEGIDNPSAKYVLVREVNDTKGLILDTENNEFVEVELADREDAIEKIKQDPHVRLTRKDKEDLDLLPKIS